ncbi:hypothetical protein P8C59_004425 [Phyllachora maydis]|uniref:Uncharacterized protein n=1 Tax=Phyllachora maydis TaxID=1825666 RepID=A0AAD9I2N0_9PEZI|nr:hypothetical protein P8C59_004425 [Phyllachora maydis]
MHSRYDVRLVFFTPARVAVILTDTKMDDKGAVAVALEKRDAQKPEKKQYDGVMLVFTGVEDRGRVAQGMNQFLLRAEKHVPAFSADWKSRLRWFKTRDNIMGDVKSHEQWYKDLQPYEPLPVATGSSLAAAIAHVDPKASVDIFQIAPCADKDVWDFIDAIPNINVYHLFFGYNSRQGSFELVKDDQDKEELAERQSKFHATLQDHLQAKHPHARVIFTQNVPTFDNAKAGSQDLDWCRQYFPKEDIDMALYDHFWSKRVREANAYADPDLQIEIPDDRDEFLRQVVEARLKPTALRTKILQVVKSALANGELTDLTDKTLRYRLGGILLPEFTGKPHPTLELGDANHMTAVMEYLDHEKAGGSTAGELAPAICHNSDNPKFVPRVEAGTSPTGQGWVLEKCKLDKTRADMEAIFAPHGCKAALGLSK